VCPIYPICVDIGGFKIFWYGVMMALAFAAAYFNWSWLSRRAGYPKAFCSDLLLCVLGGGLVGARLAYVLEDLPTYLADPLSILNLRAGGLVFYGGFLGAGLAIAWLAKLRRVPLLPLLDFTITSVPLAHAMGRLGCFLNGCCYGAVTDGALGVAYPNRSTPWYDQRYAQLITEHDACLPVHPVQLYEALFNLTLYAVVVLIYRRDRRTGFTLGVYVACYAVGRFVLEQLRGDRAHRLAVEGFSIAQFLSSMLLIIGLALVVWAWRRPRDGGSSNV
jgi:phosphatidylglycerol:prolipoprotein diacylglycerol transferase